MNISDFEKFFTKAGVQFRKVGKDIVIANTHLLFNDDGDFAGIWESTSRAISPPAKTKVGSRFANSRSTARPRQATTKKEMPWQLEHALACDEDDEHEFVQDCLRQWEEKNWLSENQLDALGRWKAKGEH